jgi:hypothetical protein
MALDGAKRLKLQHEAELANEIVIDPIEVIREPLLQDLIFQHLSGSEVKNLFTVSKTWNQAASESSTAMSKIKLKVVEYKLETISRNDSEILLKSNRRYQHAKFWFVRDKTNINREILRRRISEVIQLVEIFSPSLVDLEYTDDISYRTARSTFSSELHFPKLEKLVIHTSVQQTIAVLQGATVLKDLHSFHASISGLMFVSSSLTTLNMHMFFYMSQGDFEYIITALPNLRKLQVGGFDFVEFFKDSKLYNQNITEFIINIAKYLPNNVISSMKNLEIFNCCDIDESNLRKILTEGKRLKRVEIALWERQDLSPNEIYETLLASDRTISRNIEFVTKGPSDYVQVRGWIIVP